MSYYPSYIYGGLSVVAGLYASATHPYPTSVPCFLGGVGLGFAYLLSGYFIQKKGDPKTGYLIGTLASLSLLSVGASRYRKTTKKTLPIAFIVLGTASLYYQGTKYLEWSK